MKIPFVIHTTLHSTLLLSAIFASSAHAQSSKPDAVSGGAATETALTIVPDRPDFTDGTVVIPLGHVQIEGGATNSRSGDARGASFGEWLVRVPLQRNFEVRVGVPSYLRQRGGGSASGLDDSSLAVKLKLSETARHRPATALLLSTTLPTGARSVAEHRYQPQAKIALDYDFSDALSLGVNVGFGRPTDGGQRFSQAFASASLGFALSPRVGAYLETYALDHADASGQGARYADTGLSYLVNSRLSLDARVGFGLSNHVGGPDYFYGAGASRLF